MAVRPWSVGADLLGLFSVAIVAIIIYMKVRKVSFGEMFAEIKGTFQTAVQVPGGK